LNPTVVVIITDGDVLIPLLPSIYSLSLSVLSHTNNSQAR
jgi:hypothetical protein